MRKLSIYILLIILFVLTTKCGTDTISNTSKSKIIDDFENQLPIEPYRYTSNDDVNEFFDFKLFDNLKSPEDWLKLKDWKSIDIALRSEIEQYKNMDGYSLCIQELSTHFLDKFLLKTENTSEKSIAIKYYLNILIEENNDYWPLLTEALLAVKNKIDPEEYNTIKNYIKHSALMAIESNKVRTRLLDKSSYQLVQKRITEAEQCLKDTRIDSE